MPRPAMTYVHRGAARLLAAALVTTAGLTGLVISPAHAAGRVTVDAGGQGAVIDSTYSTELTVRGSGFQSVKGGHGGIYVWFGTVKGTWRPSKGGTSGDNYVYVPDSETKNNAGFQRYVAFPGSSTAGSANGGTMSADGSWSVKLVVPGPTFQAVGRNGSVTRVDCRTVTCGVITVGAHGVQNGNNETFTPVRLGDLAGTGATEQGGAQGDGQGGGESTSTPRSSAAGAPAATPGTAKRRGPAALTVDHAAAVSGRALSFTATGLASGEQFTVVLDDGLAAAGPFVAGADGRASGVVPLPASTSAGTHELRVFGASRDLSVKFGVQADPDLEPVSAQTTETEAGPVAAWVFAGFAGAVFLGALAFALRRAGGRRAQA